MGLARRPGEYEGWTRLKVALEVRGGLEFFLADTAPIALLTEGFSEGGGKELSQ